MICQGDEICRMYWRMVIICTLLILSRVVRQFTLRNRVFVFHHLGQLLTSTSAGLVLGRTYWRTVIIRTALFLSSDFRNSISRTAFLFSCVTVIDRIFHTPRSFREQQHIIIFSVRRPSVRSMKIVRIFLDPFERFTDPIFASNLSTESLGTFRKRLSLRLGYGSP